MLAVVATLMVCCVGGLGGALGLASVTGLMDRHGSWAAASGPDLTKTPPASASTLQWSSWVRRTIIAATEAQATALLEGDEQGFLAVVDPSNTKLVNEHRKRFRVLRAMGIGVWRETPIGTPLAEGTRKWEIGITFSYCFGPASCTAVDLPIKTSWQVKDSKLVLVTLGESSTRINGPRPWETDDLKVAVGSRVVVAATKVNEWRLSGALLAADRAAIVADQFAQWHAKPHRYVIYLAGPDDWKVWYGHRQPDWAAAWAVPVGSDVTEVVVRTDVVRQSGLEGLLTHELTHVTSLAGPGLGGGARSWWLVEGIAEYAQYLGKPVSEYDGLAPTRQFVRTKWDADVAVSAPGSSASLDDAAARYGISFLAVRRLADRFGQAKMLKFWGAVVHDNDSLDDAARSAFGASWSSVRSDCAKFVRRSVA